MCLAFPVKVVEVKGKKAKVDSQGKLKTIDVSMLAGLKKGDYILAHADLGIQKLDKKDAKETLALLNQICECGKPATGR